MGPIMHIALRLELQIQCWIIRKKQIGRCILAGVAMRKSFLKTRYIGIHVCRTLLIRGTLPLGGREEQCDSKELRRNNLILIAISQEGVEAIEL